MLIGGLFFGICGFGFYASMYVMVQIGILGNSSNVPVIHWVGASLLAMAMAMLGRGVGRKSYETQERMRELRRQDPEAFKQLQDSQLKSVFSFCVVALCIALFIWIFAAGGPRTPKKTHIGISPRGPVIIQEYDD